MLKLASLCFVILFFSCSGNNSEKYGTSANDSVQFYLQAYQRQIENSPDSAFIVAGKALLLAQRTDLKEPVMFDIFFALGHGAEKTGQYDIAISYFLKAIEYPKGVDISRLATAYNYIGQIAFRQGKYDIAMKYFPYALKIRISQNDTEGQASSYKNIGSVYQAERKYKEAEEHYMKSVELYTQITNVEGLAACYNNLGGLYADQAMYSQAFEYYQKSEQLYKQENSQEILVPIYNMGLAFMDIGEDQQAGDYFYKALHIAQKWPDNKRLLAEAYYSLGDYLVAIGQPDSALLYFSQSIEVSQRSKLDEVQVRALVSRAKAYSSLHHFPKAVSDYETATLISEELSKSDQERVKVFTQRYMQYEAEAFQQQQIQRNRMLRNFITALTFGILLICAIAFILYRNNIQKKKANTMLAKQRDEIEQKGKEIEHKNDEIEEGIRAASLVQTAVLTPNDYIKQLFPDSFILYKPQNTVSGDFYWMTQKGQYIVVVAADCTGHGVSGAVVSMLGISALNKIVGEMEIPHSDLILNKLREDIIRLLNPEGSVSRVANGMDVALAVIDTEQEKIEFSGANNSLYLIRNQDLMIIKADKMPIGVHDHQDIPFIKAQVSYQKDDLIYLFSDGYVDQFDAENRDKFKTKQFKELLKSVSDMAMEEQSKILDERHSNWRGDTVQTDDILVIGIRL